MTAPALAPRHATGGTSAQPASRTLRPATESVRALHAETDAYYHVLRTAAALVGEVSELLRPFDLTHPQYNVLRILRLAGAQGLPRGEVGERMVSRDPDVTRLLDRMEARGLLVRERETDDRRVVRVRLTDAGLALVSELEAPMCALHRAQMNGLDAGEMLQLSALLERARRR